MYGSQVPDSYGHGGRVHQYTASTGVSWNNVIDFSANINPLGPPASVLSVLRESLSVIRHYPDTSHTEVKNVLAQHFQVNPDEILCGNGASEVIDLLLQSLQPTRVVVLDPAFSEYRHSAERHRIPVLSAALFGIGEDLEDTSERTIRSSFGTWLSQPLKLPLHKLDANLRSGDLLFINSPHNPTGACIATREWLRNAKEWQERGVQVVVDESFLDFLLDESDYTAIHHAVESKALFVIRSATKFYALPGLRFGFAIGPSRHIQGIERMRDGWSVNQLAQIAAVVAYQDTRFQQDTWRWLHAEQEHVKQLWSKVSGVNLYMGKVNFFLLQFQRPEMSTRLEQHLQHQGILIRNCINFRGLEPGAYRIAIRAEAENHLLFQEVVSFMEETKA